MVCVMETRQLAYFLAACQHRNHAAAARLLGIAPSTLSTSLNLLEEELGLELFRRTREGSYPTREARWLHQGAENIVRTITRAENYFASKSDQPLRRVSVHVAVQLVLGRLSKAMSAAMNAVRDDYPEVFFDVSFGDPGRSDAPAEMAPVDLLVRYRSGHEAPAPLEVTLFEDEWVIASNTELGGLPSGSVLSDADLDGFDLSLPRLPQVLLDMADAYRGRLGLRPLPHRSDDGGALSRMSQEARKFAFLLPASSLSDRIGERQINLYHLRDPLVSKLVAIPRSNDPVLVAVARQFSARIGQPEEGQIYEPQITLRQVHYYNSVCESGNITRAAQRLRVAQPALSSQIHKIEKTLGCKLFNRKPSGLELTEKGRALRVITKALDRDVVQLHRTVATGLNLRATRLRIAVIPLTDFRSSVVQAFTQALCEWQERHPLITLQLLEGPTEVIRDWLADGHVHFGVVETPPDYGGRLALGAAEPLGVIAATGSGHIRDGGIPAGDLSRLPLILPSSVFGLRKLVDDVLTGEQALKPVMEINSLTTTLAMVAQGELVTILPQSALSGDAEAAGLVFCPITDPVIERRLYAIFSNDRELAPYERDLIGILRRNLE